MNKYLMPTAITVIIAGGGIVAYQRHLDNKQATAEPSPVAVSSPAQQSAAPTTTSAKVDQAVDNIMKESTYSLVSPEDSDTSVVSSDTESFDNADQAFNVSSNDF